MVKFTAALVACCVMSSPAIAAPAPPPAALSPAVMEAMRPIRQFLDGINTGKLDSAMAAYVHGDITIIDEFAPHVWIGPNAPRTWVEDFARDSAAHGQSEGHVRYGRPARAEIGADAAYVIIPTLYTYKLHGAPMAEEGQMTYVLGHETAGWKIKGWTWSGVTPHTPK
jgi:hypothetical protein